MTELLSGGTEVRTRPDGSPAAVLTSAEWRAVRRVASSWLVETDWWRPRPVRRHYHRCLLSDGECLELYRDLDSGDWLLARRYD